MPDQEKKRRTRIDCKINQLPPPVKQEVDNLLSDTANSFQAISDWLASQEYQISYSAVCRYASRMNKAAQRVADDLAQTKVILDYIGKNPDVDPARAAQAVMTSGLMRRISTADEEFYGMSLDKVGRLLASFRRVDIAEKKLTFDQRTKTDLAFGEMEDRLLAAVNHDPALSERFHTILLEAKERMSVDE